MNQQHWPKTCTLTNSHQKIPQVCYRLYCWNVSQTFNMSTVGIRAPSYKLTQESTYLNGNPAPSGETVPRCTIEFTIAIQLQSPVYIYYRLTNFYQNHRKYVKSLSYNQLNGENISPNDAGASCAPVATSPDGKIYYPCGLIANSMFNGEWSMAKWRQERERVKLKLNGCYLRLHLESRVTESTRQQRQYHVYNEWKRHCMVLGRISLQANIDATRSVGASPQLDKTIP